MDLGRWILFLSYILTTLFACLTNALPDFQAFYCNYDYSDSMFKKNLGDITDRLSSSEVSFHNFSIGQNPADRVNVIALCRGDVDWDVCRSCLIDANAKLIAICPNENDPAKRKTGKISIGFYDECMLRFSDRHIFSTVSTMPNFFTYNEQKVPDAIIPQFDQAVRTLLNNLLQEASRGNSVRKFATGSITTGPRNNITLYGLAECTPDLNMEQCNRCLNGAAIKLPECCNGKIGGRLLRPSCNFRYEMGRFYDIEALKV
ncbi:hypothetical protein AQUCO_01300414v1 [Aquilegia coerulea]|uniref:Gnk2-homologous domain-containing protein n=1 Tax=Aquilegia coerulea TaxID=218851 RepID=A0A2G5E237_AQUCA|nr:hypothetical protein AQUCO_01300414v1 [Aquilegia coerulea]